MEISENNEIKKQGTANSGVEEKVQTKATSKQNEEQKVNDALKSIEDLEKSDRDSNISGTSVNEDIRTLKDFKALISEKTVPKSIRILKRTIIILGVILIILTGKFH